MNIAVLVESVVSMPGIGTDEGSYGHTLYNYYILGSLPRVNRLFTFFNVVIPIHRVRPHTGHYCKTTFVCLKLQSDINQSKVSFTICIKIPSSAEIHINDPSDKV